MNQLRLNEAWAFESGDRFTWDRVLERECGTGAAGGSGGGRGSFADAMGYQTCVSQQEAEAKFEVSDAENLLKQL